MGNWKYRYMTAYLGTSGNKKEDINFYISGKIMRPRFKKLNVA